MNQSDINALLNNTATIETKIEILPKKAGEAVVTITGENSIKSWVYSDLRYVEDAGFIGQFVARTLDGELQDITDDFNIQDREIKLYLGIRVPNAQGVYSTTYYSLGNFFVQSPESNEVNDNTKFESFDYTVLFNKDFDADFKNTTYTKSFNEYIANEETVTALWLAQYVCAQAGVTLGTTNFRNNDFVINTNQFDSSFTCRDVIKSIAKLAYTWARIGWDNKLYFDFTVKTTVDKTYNNITNDNYYKLITQKEKYGPVNRVLIGTSFAEGDNEHIDDAASIAANGLTELFIADNPLTYTEEIRKRVITSGNCLFGLQYSAIDMETTGHPWLQGNELIGIQDMEGKMLYTYPFDRVLKFNGHIKSQITSYAKTSQEESMIYEGTDSSEGLYKKTQIVLDRQNQEITALSEKIDKTTDSFRISKHSTGVEVETENAGAYLPNNFVFYGNLEQKTTTGSNLMPISITTQTINGITATRTSDGFIHLSGTATANTVIPLSTTNENVTFPSNVYLQYENDFQTTNAQVTFNNGTTGVNSLTLGELNRIYDMSSRLGNKKVTYIYLYVNNGTTLNGKFRPMIHTKGMTIQPYEPYTNGISPNPLFPQRIDVVEGYNLFDGIYRLGYNPSSSTVTHRATSKYIDIKPNTTYTCSMFNTNPSKVAQFYIYQYGVGGNIIKEGPWRNSGLNFTTESNTSYISICFKYTDDSGLTVDTFKDTLLTEGEEEKPYLSDNAIGVEISGKNMCNPSKARLGTYSGITITYNEDYLVLNGTATAIVDVYLYHTSNSVNKPLIDYLNSHYGDYVLSNNLGYKNYIRVAGAYKENTFTTSTSAQTDGAFIRVPQGTVCNNTILRVQLEPGKTASEYEAYKGKIISLPTKGMFFAKIGDVQDTGYVDFTKGQIVRNGKIGKIVLNGTEGWAYNTGATNGQSYINLPSMMKVSKNTNVYSTIAIASSVSTKDNTISGDSYGNLIFKNIKVNGTYISSAAEMKAYLNQNPVTVYYVLEESVVETADLTETELEQLRLDVGYNRLKMLTTIDSTIDLTYLTDNELNGIYSTQTQLKLENNRISSSVSETREIIGANYDDLANKLDKKLEDSDLGPILSDYASTNSVTELTNKVESYQSSTQSYIGIVQNIRQNGVDKLVTETGYTFDKDGLTIEKTGAETKTTITENGMTIYDTTGGSTNKAVQVVDNTGVYSENVKINTYLIVGTHCRFENYEGGTGAFYI